jgi:hypothetical protein
MLALAGMAVISGLPTVVGGVADFEFLSSIEVLDNSADENSPFGLEWRVAAYTLSSPKYDFAMATIPIRDKCLKTFSDCNLPFSLVS